jgi:hypothetical protein
MQSQQSIRQEKFENYSNLYNEQNPQIIVRQSVTSIQQRPKSTADN